MRTALVVWTVLAAAISLVAVTDPQAPTATQSAGSITGSVVDGRTGVILTGAIVDLDLRGKGRVASQAATTQGGFAFRDLAPGDYVLRARVPGYFAGTFRQRRLGGPGGWLSIADAQVVRGIAVPVWQLGSISGSVTGEQGEVLAGLTVSLIPRMVFGGIPSWTGRPATTRTDDRGHYEFASVVPGPYLLRLDVPDLAVRARGSGGPQAKSYSSTYFYPSTEQYTLASTVSIAPGDEFASADFSLARHLTYAISGHVLDARYPGAAVTLCVDDRQSGASIELARTVADSRGGFVFANVVPGDYRIQATIRSGAGRAPDPQYFGPSESPGLSGQVRVSLDKQHVANVEIPMRATASMKGSVVFRGEQPSPQPRLDEMLVIVTEPNGTISGGGSFSASVRSDGHFEVKGLTPGAYLAQVIPGFQPAGWALGPVSFENRDISQSPISVDGSGLDGIRVELVKGAAITGVVRASSGGLDADATVLAFPVEPNQWSGNGRWPPRFRSDRVSATGTYLLEDLTPGDYYIVAVKEEATVDWQSRDTLRQLAPLSKRVHAESGGRLAQPLSTQLLKVR